MDDEAPTGVMVTFWRCFNPSRMVAFRPGQEDALQFVAADEQLLEEMFTWQAREDIWGGVVDDDLRASLRKQLFESFRPSESPESRSIAAFSKFVNDLGVAAESSSSEWATSALGSGGDARSATRINPLLALYTQLRWLTDVFRDVPGMSVSVR